MIEFCFEILVHLATLAIQFLLEMLVEGAFELVITFGWESLGHAIGRRQPAHPVLGCAGWVMIGVASGGVSAYVMPDPLIPTGRFRGISLILAPLVTGTIMKIIGERRREQLKPVRVLATFWGGSAFALAFSLTRFLLLRSR